MSFPRLRPRLLVIALSVLSLTVMMLVPVAAVAEEPVPSYVGSSVLLDGDDGWEDASYVNENFVDYYAGSLEAITKDAIKTEELRDEDYDGSGITVALIDSGVVPVPGLDGPGKVINGLDVSFESQSADLRYMDTFGHGTHLAGIIAGNDSSTGFKGVAPGANILNVKVANHEGAVDVSQVIAAIDWVIQHRNDNGMNVRVINLAYGTDSTQNWQVDPLSAAVDRAWRAGIVVVVAAGNDGNGNVLRNPAMNPYVIAVGASDSNYTRSVGDDFVAGFTNCGSASRYIDVLAPGRSIISVRNPGSVADVEHPEARIGDDLFLGSGTSQAAAVVSGSVALILDAFPNATPDQVKGMLMYTSRDVASSSNTCGHAGLIDLEYLFKKFGDIDDLGSFGAQSYGYADGSGSLELARGSHHVSVDGVVLVDEQDIFGMKWNTEYIAKLAANGMAWSSGDFNGTSWSGTSWSGTSWSGTSWSGTSWSGTSWSGTSWSDYVWSGTSWSGTSWSGTSWSGSSWTGSSWTGASWTNDNWLGLSWG